MVMCGICGCEIPKKLVINRMDGNCPNCMRMRHFLNRIEEIERLKSENYISIDDMLKSCEQCIYKTIIAQALEYINSNHKQYQTATYDIRIKEILEGKRVE